MCLLIVCATHCVVHGRMVYSTWRSAHSCLTFLELVTKPSKLNHQIELSCKIYRACLNGILYCKIIHGKTWRNICKSMKNSFRIGTFPFFWPFYCFAKLCTAVFVLIKSDFWQQVIYKWMEHIERLAILLRYFCSKLDWNDFHS